MYKFLPDSLNVMFSAAGFWDADIGEWRKGKKFKKSFGLTFLDCGGFTLLNNYGDYPFSVINYANLVARLRPNYYATMDYPCEPEISRELELTSNQERIRATVKNAVALAEWEDHLPGRMVPVIQGYDLDEYIYCLDQYDQAGLIRPYMAVGSMCRRISDTQLAELIPGIYYAARSRGCDNLHFFGLKMTESITTYNDMIYSRDSAAVLASYHGHIRRQRNWRRFPKSKKEKEDQFMAFLDKCQKMDLNYCS